MTQIQRNIAALIVWGWFAIYGQADEPLSDWYEIEVILFLQPKANLEQTPPLTDELKQRGENLVVEAPPLASTNFLAFALTEKERAAIQMRSSEVDLSTGSHPWFFSSDFEFDSAITSDEHGEDALTQWEFPDWLLNPEQSYDDLFITAFNRLPYGGWFSTLALAFDDQEEEQDDELVEETAETDELTYNEAPSPTREEVESLVDEHVRELASTSFVMNESNVRLPRTGARLRTNGVDVIKHFKWHQLVLGRNDQSQRVFFQSFNQYTFEGYFNVTKGRFIHLDVHVWLDLPEEHANLKRPVFELKETRRMNRNDVHYFDHPRFGILAEVVRLELPNELQTLWDALD